MLPSIIRAIVCGPSNCGKTNVLISMLESPHGVRFENVYVVTWRPWAPRRKGYCPIGGEGGISGIVFSLSGRERSSPLLLRARSHFLFKFKKAAAWVVGSLGNVHLERRFNDQDLGAESANVPESAACPESDSSVWYSDRRGSTLKWSFRIHTAAREREPVNLPVPRNGRRIQRCKGRPRADANLGLASQIGPALSSGSEAIEHGSLHYRLKEQVDSRKRRISGTMPEIIDEPIEGAVNSWKDDVRERSAQETRSLGQATAASTVRWAIATKGRIPNQGPGEANLLRSTL